MQASSTTTKAIDCTKSVKVFTSYLRLLCRWCILKHLSSEVLYPLARKGKVSDCNVSNKQRSPCATTKLAFTENVPSGGKQMKHKVRDWLPSPSFPSCYLFSLTRRCPVRANRTVFLIYEPQWLQNDKFTAGFNPFRMTLRWLMKCSGINPFIKSLLGGWTLQLQLYRCFVQKILAHSYDGLLATAPWMGSWLCCHSLG